MIDRLFWFCFAVLAAALAIYVTVRLIESIAAALIAIVAAIGGVIVLSIVVRFVWWRHRMNHW